MPREVHAAGSLVQAQAERGQGGYEMLYDVGGDVLVGDPVLFTGEEVELYRQAFRGGGQLADEDAQVGVDLGQGAEVVLGGGPEQSEIDRGAVQDKVSGPFLGNHAVQFLRSAETYRVDVYIQGTGHTAALALAHASPVLEGVADEDIRRDGCDGIVPVAHLDSIQRHLLNRAVDPVFVHDYPVSRPEHVVSRELHSRHQS